MLFSHLLCEYDHIGLLFCKRHNVILRHGMDLYLQWGEICQSEPFMLCHSSAYEDIS